MNKIGRPGKARIRALAGFLRPQNSGADPDRPHSSSATAGHSSFSFALSSSPGTAPRTGRRMHVEVGPVRAMTGRRSTG